LIEKRFIFVGNRRFVLEEMLAARLGLVAILIIDHSHLQRDFHSGILPPLPNIYTISNKADLLNFLNHNQFDILVSNGCPYILPVEHLPHAQYVNIHPSFLPDLRGSDPTIGSLLFKRDSGATCHVMDKGIDTGPIISQVRIPFTDDLDVITLYQLSFIAEKRVFKEALERDFIPKCSQKKTHADLYYSRKPEDRIITFQESNEEILCKVRAFNNRSQGCEFIAKGNSYRVYGATRMINPFLMERVCEFDEGVVALSYENNIIFKKDREILRLQSVFATDGSAPEVGDRLFGTATLSNPFLKKIALS